MHEIGPISLLLCEVATHEARFYDMFGYQLDLVPTCWHSEYSLHEDRGWLILDEPVGLRLIASLILVSIGTVLVNQRKRS